MASKDAVRALRNLTRARNAVSRTQQRRYTLCTKCLAKEELRNTSLGSRCAPAAPAVQRDSRRQMATMAEYRQHEYNQGPIAEYDARVKAGKLRDDEHQRNLIQALQDLHDALLKYSPPEVIPPTIDSLQPKKKSFFGSLFGGAEEKVQMEALPYMPKGLYMYGDVGSGKTMLMDLFYDTLPDHIKHKTRIHFHNFMQEVHRELHKMKIQHGSDIDAIPFVAASIASRAGVLCFDEFQCTDVADAMILRRLIESLMAHGTVLVTTSNRKPSELYKNGIQRASFIPCIKLLEEKLRVLNLDSTTDYRKIPRPPSGVYHHPLDAAADRHAQHWFRFLGDFDQDPPHQATHRVWGRNISVPRASGRACHFTFDELLGRATGAADYIELMRSYDAFVVTGVPSMSIDTRDVARRFITFIDAVYESRAKLVLTTAAPLTQLFMTKREVKDTVEEVASKPGPGGAAKKEAKKVKAEGSDLDASMRSLMDDLGMNMKMLKSSSIFSGSEEAFAFARALSRLSEMGSQEWVERGLGLEKAGGKKEQIDWQKVRSHWQQDSYGSS